MQIGALTVKITDNINKINNLLEVDKDIKKDVVNSFNNAMLTLIILIVFLDNDL